MPTWTDNTVYVTGSKEGLAAFASLAGTPHKVRNQVWNSAKFQNDWVDAVQEQSLSFFNFIAPRISALEEYYTTQERPDIPSSKSNHWFDWNVRNWDTKWDACDVQAYWSSDHELRYEFKTAWREPKLVFVKMIAMFPELNFHFMCISEGGGGETHYESVRGVLYVEA